MNRLTSLLVLALLLPIQAKEPLPEGARFRIGSGLFRDEMPISAATIAPDGKSVAILSQSNRIRFLEIPSGKEIRAFATINGGFRPGPFQFSKDGKRLLISTYQGLSIYSLAESHEQVIQWQRNNEGSTSLAMDRILAIGSQDFNGSDGYVDILDLDSSPPQTRRITISGAGVILPILSPDGSKLATWASHPPSKNNDPDLLSKVSIRDVATGQLIQTIKVNSPNIQAVQFSPNGKRLATSGASQIEIWDVATGKPISRLATRMSQGVNLFFSLDGKELIASSNRDAVLQRWDIATSQRLPAHEGPVGSNPQVRFLPGGTILAATISHSSIHIWDVLTGRMITPLESHSLPVIGIQFAANGKSFWSIGADSEFRNWSTETGLPVSEMRRLEEPRNRSFFRRPSYGGSIQTSASPQMLFSPNGKYLIGPSDIGPASAMIDIKTGNELFALQVPGMNPDRQGPIVFSPDARKVVFLNRYDSRPNQGIPVWDVETGLSQPLLKGQMGEGTAAAFRADGEFLATAMHQYTPTGANSEVWVWHLAKQIEVTRISGEGICHGLLWLDDRKLLVARTKSWKIIDAFTGKEIGGFPVEYPHLTSLITKSPDGRLLAAAFLTNPSPTNEMVSHIHVFEIASQTIRHARMGHRGRVCNLAFSPDSKFLASGGVDTTILLWDLQPKLSTGKPLESAWNDLEKSEATTAFEAMSCFASDPRSYDFLADKLKSFDQTPVDDATIQTWIENLDAARFAIRERATGELERLGNRARPAIEAKLKQKPTLELRTRLEQILERFDHVGEQRIWLRPLRAIEVLERNSTSKGKELLQRIASGTKGLPITDSAKSALDRLKRFSSEAP
jgi:WD40 repeat protein